jgi:hypothetical protein
MIVDPPVTVGGDQVSVAEVPLTVAPTEAGAPGTVAAVPWL